MIDPFKVSIKVLIFSTTLLHDSISEPYVVLALESEEAGTGIGFLYWCEVLGWFNFTPSK